MSVVKYLCRVRLSGLLRLSLFLLAVGNLVFVFLCNRGRKPQIVRHSSVTTNFVYSVRTQYIDRAVSPSSVSVPASSATTNSVRVAVTDYHYFLVSHRKAVKMWGRYFFEGSLTSYGRIASIWPDRVLLEEGGELVNANSERKPVNDIRTSDRFIEQVGHNN